MVAKRLLADPRTVKSLFFLYPSFGQHCQSFGSRWYKEFLDSIAKVRETGKA